MKTIRIVFFLLIALNSLNSHSQTDLLADPSSFGFTFLDAKKTEKCRMCKEEIISLNEKFAKMDKNISTKEVLTVIQEELDKEVIGNRKAKIMLYMIDCLIRSKNENQNISYNLSFDEYPDIDKAKKGALEIIDLFDKAIEYAEDEASKKFLKRARMHYIVHTDLYDELSYLHDFDQYYTLNESIENLKGADKIIVETLNNDYVSTGSVPFTSYNGINLGLNILQGKTSWIGGEISFDQVGHRNPFRMTSSKLSFRNNFHVSMLGIGFFKNLSNESFDITTYLVNIRKESFGFAPNIFSANLVQFGFHKGYSAGNSWFYRPEIGLSYGPISLCYGYNVVFKKAVRPFTESHFVTLKLNYPMIRTSKYF
jgi:hypothetical protein